MMIKLFVILSLSFFLSLANAAVVDPYAPEENLPELEQITSQTSLAKAPEPKIEKTLSTANNIAVLYTYTQSGFQQQGLGQNYDTESGIGRGIFTSYDMSLASENEVNFQAWLNQAIFLEPANIGGNDVSVQRILLSTVYSWRWQNNNQEWHIDFGATALSQKPSNFTTDENLVSDYMAIGPTIGGGYKYLFSKSWKFKTSAALSYPGFFKENGEKSGYHSLSRHFLGKFLIEAKISPSLFLTFGVFVENEEHRFNGSGERGVEDAILSYTAITIPTGVSYVF